MEIKFQERGVKPKCSIDKKTTLLQFFTIPKQHFIIGIYFYVSAIIFENKIVFKNLFLITQVDLTILLRWTLLLPTKSNNSRNYSLQARKHYFLFWSIITTKLIYISIKIKYISMKMIMFVMAYCKLSA